MSRQTEMLALKGEDQMSMEDVLKVLVESRQEGSSAQSGELMTNLIGGLLGGGQSQSGTGQQSGEDLVGGIASLLGSAMGGGQSQPQAHNAGNQQSGGLGNMMGLLETVMGGGQNSSAANDPIMVLLNPFVAPLAKKAKIPPETAMIIVSFAAHKLLAHHPTSERDSNSFDLENMLQQINSGKIDPKLLHNSGMVKEISAKTGLDDAAAEKSLNLAFSLVGKSAAGLIKKD
jgi:hypothetical protein